MNAIFDRFRCPEEFANARLAAPSAAGRNGAGLEVFDPTPAVDNLRLERYVHGSHRAGSGDPASASMRVYNQFIRPFLPFALRRRLQRIYFQHWDKIPFPQWPVDFTVENLLEKALLLLMKADGVDAIPFIWFWPDGAPSAAMVTHDVETTAGRDFCGEVMDMDAAFGIPSAFQIIPESRYSVSPEFLDAIRRRGHEINVHDLHHDGRLFADHNRFRSQVQLINQYGRDFRARGFRSGVLYRNVKWFDELEFEYDMSVPNVGHLEAQRGGCCTVFPYFIGNILELPLTTTQDYTLFHILRKYDLDLWTKQAGAIMERHGLLSFVTHPDYLMERRAQETYRDLLGFLAQRRDDHGMWIATPGEVNQWWRERSQMALVRHDGEWRIEGPGRERAQIAYATAAGGRIVYSLENGTACSNGSMTPAFTRSIS